MTPQELKDFRAARKQVYHRDAERSEAIIDEYFVELCKVAEVLAKNEQRCSIETPFGYFNFLPNPHANK